MLKLFLVGAGGFLGSISRYIVSGLFSRIFEKSLFPYGTLAVNVIGCLIIGFLGGLVENRQLFSPEIRLFVFIGFLGGFTTYSTFGYEIFTFAHDGQMMTSFINLTLHFILGLGAVWVGFSLSKCL